MGVSYPSVPHLIQSTFSNNKTNLYHLDPCVEQAIELVRRKALTQMDGRDLARVLAVESSNDTHCYTVSLERAAVYYHRHMNANFNRKSFCSEIKERFGEDIKFRQIILDYFWIPSGTWQFSHWKSTFFNTTLPNFVKEGLIDYNPGLYDVTSMDDKGNDNDYNVHTDDDEATKHNTATFSTSGKGGGVVYLPFCLHCVQQLLASYTVLMEYYTIEFVYKHELEQK